jgi:hypothetical protein
MEGAEAPQGETTEAGRQTISDGSWQSYVASRQLETNKKWAAQRITEMHRPSCRPAIRCVSAAAREGGSRHCGRIGRGGHD